MQRVVLEQSLGFVATVSRDGRPNLSPKGTTTVWDEHHLMFADIASPGTVENLASNPDVEINVVDPIVRKGYRFEGHATVHTGGVMFDRGLGVLRERGSRRSLNVCVPSSSWRSPTRHRSCRPRTTTARRRRRSRNAGFGITPSCIARRTPSEAPTGGRAHCVRRGQHARLRLGCVRGHGANTTIRGSQHPGRVAIAGTLILEPKARSRAARHHRRRDLAQRGGLASAVRRGERWRRSG